jgi:TetR/AcrR family transcriptional regulator, transcriptional repressor for nem operon
MARPSEFDRDDVLHRAMEVFWCQGFEATGMPDLVEAMGIGRQSLYNAFESKRGLFLEALELYQAERARSLQKVLSSAATPLQGIETLLTSIAAATGVARTRGCMSVNTATEIGLNDGEVAAIVKRGALKSKADLAAAMTQAKALGELPDELDEQAAADFVLTVMRGLRVSGKAGATVGETRNVVRMAMAALRHFQDPA